MRKGSAAVLPSPLRESTGLRALVRVGNVKQRISRRALSAPCERMSGGRTHISERGKADRPVTDGASLATAVGRVCGQQHALFQPIEGERPPMQQQQQIQPKDDKKE